MAVPIEIKPDDPILDQLNFVPHRSSTERRVERFMPADGEPQTLEIRTPWGTELTAKRGDYIIGEILKPGDRWPVDAEIFEATYTITRPGYCVKSAITYLVPMTDLTGGDPNQMVSVHSLEGVETLRAGDFYLARGIKGEIWAYPKEKASATMVAFTPPPPGKK